MGNRTGTIRIYRTHVSVWEERVDETAMRRVFRSLLARMLRRGWSIQRDPRTVKNYPSIADWHWSGTKGDLWMQAETRGRTASVEFFQELNVDNPNGGRYDHDKFARMPPSLRGRCVVEMAVVVRRLFEHGYAPGGRRGPSTAVDPDNLLRSVLRLAEDQPHPDILVAFNAGWNFPSGRPRFERDERGWPTVGEYDRNGRNRDRDGVPLRNGETRYFRGRNGRLLRGSVFTNMNEMWSIDTGCGRHYMHRSKLFHCERPDIEQRRVMPGQADRLLKELKGAIENKAYTRAATLARALAVHQEAA